MIVCQKRAQSDYNGSNVKKINVQKLHHYLKFSMMFCFGGFRYNEWTWAQWVRVHTLTKEKHETRHSTHFP